MQNPAMDAVLSYASVISVFVIGLVQLVKTTAVQVPKNYIPLIALATGLAVGAVSFPFTNLDMAMRLWAGGIAGLSSTGLFELAFNKRTQATMPPVNIVPSEQVVQQGMQAAQAVQQAIQSAQNAPSVPPSTPAQSATSANKPYQSGTV